MFLLSVHAIKNNGHGENTGGNILESQLPYTHPSMWEYIHCCELLYRTHCTNWQTRLTQTITQHPKSCFRAYHVRQYSRYWSRSCVATNSPGYYRRYFPCVHCFLWNARTVGTPGNERFFKTLLRIRMLSACLCFLTFNS